VLIALTGGIGSGKSTVARRWVELGATEVDADLLAREVVEPGSVGLAQVVQEFGASVLTAAGALDRAELARIAFANDDNRIKLEGILHPLIQELALQKVTNLEGVIVYTIPLFVESKSKLKFDKVVAISCDEEVRIKRLVESRGMSEAEARSRISAQAKDSEREAVADIIIDSNCSLAELTQKVDAIYQSFKDQS
jgi:dephospho-CoA kinase